MRLLVSGIALAIACVGFADGAHVVRYPSHVSIKQNSFIVELHEDAHDAHVLAVRNHPDISVNHHFDGLFRGMAVTVDSSFHPSHFSSLSNIKKVWPNRVHTLKYLPGAGNGTTPYLHQATGVADAVANLGLDGTGVKIGIIDTGVDYEHPDLGGCWKTKGCKWQYGGSYASSSDDVNAPPKDCVGHGTHVAGIIGAQGSRVQGVAPGATLGMYGVFPCSDDSEASTDDANVINAMNAAFKDGHDIISMSLGDESPWEETPVAVLASKLVSKGVVVVVANGNSGESGLITAATPAVGQGVISVGSVDNWNMTGTPGIFTTSQGEQTVLVVPSTALNATFDIVKDTPVVMPRSKAGNNLACDKIEEDLSGKIALVQRGECMFDDKAAAVQAAGAVAVIFYNNVAGYIDPQLSSYIRIPCATISMDDGEKIVKSIEGSSSKSTVRAPASEFFTTTSPTGGQMSSFSSYGPTAELGMAPLISAPGGNIFSTVPQSMGSYASYSGTSMATPYISGTVALLLQARAGLKPAQVRELLVTTAKPVTDPKTGLKANPYSSGGGLVSIYDAVQARALIDPPVLPINNTRREHKGPINDSIRPINAFWETHSVTIQNTDRKKPMRISHEHVAANSITMFAKNGTLSQQLLVNKTMPTWPANTAAVPTSTMPQVLGINGNKYVMPGQSTEVSVFIAPPLGLPESERWFYGGFINFKLTWDGESETSDYVVPYGGFNGDWRQLNIFSTDPDTRPSLADSNSTKIEHTGKLTITDDAEIRLTINLDMPTRLITATMVDSKNKTMGYLLYGYTEYIGRSLPAEQLSYIYPVNSTVFQDTELTNSTKLRAGDYHIHIEALRPFGNPESKSDYQMWDSEVFKLN
ncbi:hypothetical protein GGF43_000711 [Coemansia sp. RSA 2618]|nr:hypothetical protein GGF43_000711 [Coemansia sp. RSA 2618]